MAVRHVVGALRPWHASRENIAALIEWMGETGAVDAQIAADVVRRPEAYAEEWREYQDELVRQQMHDRDPGDREP